MPTIVQQPTLIMPRQDSLPIVPAAIPLTRDGGHRLSTIIIFIHWLGLMQVLPTVAPNAMPAAISTIRPIHVMVAIALIITVPLPTTFLRSFLQIAQAVIAKMPGNLPTGIMIILTSLFTAASIKANGAIVPTAIPMPVTIRYSVALSVMVNQKLIKTIKG